LLAKSEQFAYIKKHLSPKSGGNVIKLTAKQEQQKEK